mgnify:CR=1 FL=1
MAVMAFAPVGLSLCGIGLAGTTGFVAWHVVAMYAPALLIIPLLRLFRPATVAGFGLADWPTRTPQTLALDEMRASIDEISRATGLAPHVVSANLALMELKGLVHQVGGMNYVTAR